MSTTVRRVWLFVRDLWQELPAVWSWARTADCERNGGHRWGDASYDKTMKSWGQACSRCGCWQSTPETSHTGNAITIYPNATSGTRLMGVDFDFYEWTRF